MEYVHTTPQTLPTLQAHSWRKTLDVCILIFINFMNYTDRYSLAGILIEVQEQFHIKNDQAGLIQTLFILTYTITAPIFGYFGDRYNRKYLLALGVTIWHLANVGGSLVQHYWLFLMFRSVLGIGQACYTTISPSVISDLYVGDLRSRLLAIFYSAIPVGNGLAYIVGTKVAEAFGTWRWSLRVTAFVGAVNVLLLLLVVQDPKRGLVEGRDLKITPWREDVKYLLKNKSFMFSTMGFTAVAFTTGVVTWWAPKLNILGFRLKDPKVNIYTQGTVFGTVSLFSGFLGLFIGYFATFKLKAKCSRIDPLVCGVGLALSAPLMAGTTYASMSDKNMTYTLLFFGFVFMNVNWALTMVICMCVVVPTRRASATGIQLLIGHTFGDAGSPYLAGLISELLFDYYQSLGEVKSNEFYALQHAYYLGLAVELLAAAFFFITSLFIVDDLAMLEIDAAQGRKDYLENVG